MAGTVAILGGSFNPVHIGHLLLAQSAFELGLFERVVFMPTNQVAHKDGSQLAPALDRVAMLRLAVGDNEAFSVSELEIMRGGVSYAYDSMVEWHAAHGGEAPGFIIGMDSLLELHTWHRVKELLPLCRFITMIRPGYDAMPAAEDLKLPEPWPARLLSDVYEGRSCAVSSSEIRERLAQKREIRYLVPESVERYIARRHLYQ